MLSVSYFILSCFSVRRTKRRAHRALTPYPSPTCNFVCLWWYSYSMWLPPFPIYDCLGWHNSRVAELRRKTIVLMSINTWHGSPVKRWLAILQTVFYECVFIPLRIYPKGSIKQNTALVRTKAWSRTGDKPVTVMAWFTGTYIFLIWVIITSGIGFMMTSLNWNIFRVTGLLWRESTGHRWIPLTETRDTELW